MKRLLAIFLIILLVVGAFASCGKKKTLEEPTEEVTEEITEAPTDEVIGDIDGDGGNGGDGGDGGNGGNGGNTGDNGDGGNTGDNGDGGNGSDNGDGGNTGDNGDGGNTGDNGDGGNTGDNGDSGNTGDNGDGGNTGDNGDGGNGGNTSDNGDSGNTGDNGDSGNTGDNGDGGNTGDNGDGGNTGDNGDGGNTGDNGDGGNTGDNGDGGNTGDNGDGDNTGDNGDGGNGGNGDNSGSDDGSSTPKPIENVEELKDITLNGDYYLTEDLDLGGAEWTPIGDADSPFTGNFNGNGYTISNFTIKDEMTYAGLFGYNTGTIESLNLKNVTIDITNTSTSLYVGALVGKNEGTVKKCYADGTISGKVNNFDENKAACIGGLIGYDHNGTIEECAANSEISAYSNSQNSCAGGLIGYSKLGYVMNCYALGNVESCYDRSTFYEYSSTAGGLIGHNSGSTIKNCYASGDICSYALKGGVSFAGGLIGDHSHAEVGTEIKEYVIGAILNCYATGNIVCNASLTPSYVNASAFCGRVNVAAQENVTNNYYCSEQTIDASTIYTYGEEKSLAELKSEAFIVGTLEWSADVWNITDGAHPTLKALLG